MRSDICGTGRCDQDEDIPFMEIRIRDAVAEDLPAVLPLLTQLDVGKDRNLSLAGTQKIFEHIQAYPHYHLCVAVAQARIVGTFVLMLIDCIAHVGMPYGLVLSFPVQ